MQSLLQLLNILLQKQIATKETDEHGCVQKKPKNNFMDTGIWISYNFYM